MGTKFSLGCTTKLHIDEKEIELAINNEEKLLGLQVSRKEFDKPSRKLIDIAIKKRLEILKVKEKK